jgi:hypothetical protein
MLKETGVFSALFGDWLVSAGRFAELFHGRSTDTMPTEDPRNCSRMSYYVKYTIYKRVVKRKSHRQAAAMLIC